jgi:Reverse transcriptase (RNA-dependent DNA polymerase)
MQQPSGFIDSLQPNHVYNLRKALYSLKQAPRAWFHKLKAFLLSHQFTCSTVDNSLFICHINKLIIYILVYVDDIIITDNDSETISSLINTLNSTFSIKDLGQLHYFLGIEIVSSGTDLILNQSRYLKSILARENMIGAKSCTTPMQYGLQLSKTNDIPLSDPHLYRTIVGALQYATITRSDLTFGVNKVSQFVANPTDIHWQAVKRILRYIAGTLHHGIQLQRCPHLSLNAYCDADWAGCPDDRRSTTGFAIYLRPNIVSWSSKKQATVSRSSTEAEYRSLAVTTSELLWLTSLLTELGHQSPKLPVLWCDNLDATFIAANSVFHARTKYIELDFHFVL